MDEFKTRIRILIDNPPDGCIAPGHRPGQQLGYDHLLDRHALESLTPTREPFPGDPVDLLHFHARARDRQRAIQLLGELIAAGIARAFPLVRRDDR